MKMISFETKSDDLKPAEANSPQYPTLYLRGDQIPEEMSKAEPGAEFTMQIKVKVTGKSISADEKEKRKTCDLSILSGGVMSKKKIDDMNEEEIDKVQKGEMDYEE